jgi:hypothetical protein
MRAKWWCSTSRIEKSDVCEGLKNTPSGLKTPPEGLKKPPSGLLKVRGMSGAPVIEQEKKRKPSEGLQASSRPS